MKWQMRSVSCAGKLTMRRASAFRLPLKCDSSPQACLTTSSFAEANEVRLSPVLREKAVCVRMLVHGISRPFLPSNPFPRTNSRGVSTYTIREANSFRIRTCAKIPGGQVHMSPFAKCIARRGAQAALTTPSRSAHVAARKSSLEGPCGPRDQVLQNQDLHKMGWGVPPFSGEFSLARGADSGFLALGERSFEIRESSISGVLSTRGRVRSATPKKKRRVGVTIRTARM